VRFHRPGLLRVGLRTSMTAEPSWDDIVPRAADQWQTEVRPVRLLTSSEGPVTRVTWYVAEGWYADQEQLEFDVRNVRFLAAP
jgi:hypothetical protein